MEKSIFEEMGGTYEIQGDYLIPCLTLQAEKENVTEKLKAEDQMTWVARMNNIRSRVTEIVNHDIIYN
jgi:hypothetical protein